MKDETKRQTRLWVQWMEQEVIRRTGEHQDAYFQEQLFDKERSYHAGLIKKQVRTWLKNEKLTKDQRAQLIEIGKSAAFLQTFAELYRMGMARARVEVADAHQVANQLGEDIQAIRKDLQGSRQEAAQLRARVRDLEEETKALQAQIRFHEKNQ